MNKKLQIRNSTAEFLIFTTQNEEDSIEVKVVDEKSMNKFGNSEFTKKLTNNYNLDMMI